jgi:hypothetical protein
MGSCCPGKSKCNSGHCGVDVSRCRKGLCIVDTSRCNSGFLVHIVQFFHQIFYYILNSRGESEHKHEVQTEFVCKNAWNSAKFWGIPQNTASKNSVFRRKSKNHFHGHPHPIGAIFKVLQKLAGPEQRFRHLCRIYPPMTKLPDLTVPGYHSLGIK